MSEEAFKALEVVALRKAVFYQRSRDILLKNLPADINKEQARRTLRETISELDNSLFISKREKETKRIDPSSSIDDLDLDKDKIKGEILVRLGSSPD